MNPHSQKPKKQKPLWEIQKIMRQKELVKEQQEKQNPQQENNMGQKEHEKPATPKNLFLDDTREPSHVYPADAHNWYLVTRYEEFVEYFVAIAESGKTENMPAMVSFDYMLGTIKDGASCALFLVEFCLQHGLKLPDCNVHSTYPYATREIRRELSKYADATDGEPIYVELVHHNF